MFPDNDGAEIVREMVESQKEIADLGGVRFTAHDVWMLMQRPCFVSLDNVNPKCIEPDWLGFFDGALLRMTVDPVEFYCALSKEVAE